MRLASNRRAAAFRVVARAAFLALLLGAVASSPLPAGAEGQVPASASVDEGALAKMERPEVQIGWTETPPELNGRIDPAEWADAAYVDEFGQARPDEGKAPTQRTEVWIMTDEEHLYIAARLWDTHPEEIVASQMARDANTAQDDRFGFTIDPFLDRQNGYFFQVNANGVRRDFLIEGSKAESSWDGRWYAKARVDAEGWSVEIALPYATINFDAEADVWGFNMARGIRRRDEIDRWSDPVRDRFLIAMGRAGNLVGMRGVKQGLGLQIVPALTARRVDDFDDLPSEDQRRNYTRFDPSLDAFYKITPSVTTSLTVNTDFGETEADDRQVNLDRFALFFPEKRDFFLQDALIFDFGEVEENGRPFFSRRIGLSSSGEPEGILAGAKVTGRIGPVKLGILDVVLDEHDQVDQQNLLVARGALNLGESTLGLIMTHGDPSGTSENGVVGADFIYRNSNFGESRTLRGSAWFQSSFSNPDTGPNAESDPVNGTGFAYGGSLTYPNDKHDAEAQIQILDEDFNPALGFANRTGIRRYSARYRRRWRPDSDTVQLVDSELDARLITGFSPDVQTAELTWSALELTSPIGDAIRFQYNHRYEFVESEFSNFVVPRGRYHFDEGRIRLQASLNRPVGGEVTFTYGDFFDGTRARVEADATIRFSKHIQTGLIYELNDIRLPGGNERIQLLRGRLSLFFTPDISWVTLVQFDTISDSISINSRFRWIIEDGRELFLVLNQGFDARDDVRATRTAPLAKLQWTVRF
ncbi:MAG: DUF5916 domain-containing protein [Myxococcota bacterium]